MLVNAGLSDFETKYFESAHSKLLLKHVTESYHNSLISKKELADRVAITFEDITEWYVPNQSSFQCEMFFDGRIRLTYLNIAPVDGLVGLSKGPNPDPNKPVVPADFVETNFNTLGLCTTPIAGDINGDGVKDLTDVTSLYNFLNGIVAVAPIKGDVNKDTLINTADVDMLIGHLVNQSPAALP